MAHAERARFVVCVTDQGCDDLTAWKLYRVLPDEKAAQESYLRIVDDSGEDYLYPMQRFVEVEVSEASVEALMSSAKSDEL
ncbi:MAG TPA: hypothetical protein VNH11_34450 [Pirellulales bacterium]|nr:hypothetical protein [Pirellulales bacterium]